MAKRPLEWEEKISLKSLHCNQPEEFQLDQNCPSIQNLLDELEANLEERDRGNGSLHLNLTVELRSDSHYGDYLLFQGNIQSAYYSPCVRCLVPARCTLDIDFSSCFLSHHYEDTEEYRDVTTLYIGGREREVYFYEKGVANLQETLHENIFINVNPLPLHDPNCRGICSTCRVNLNISPCRCPSVDKQSP